MRWIDPVDLAIVRPFRNAKFLLGCACEKVCSQASARARISVRFIVLRRRMWPLMVSNVRIICAVCIYIVFAPAFHLTVYRLPLLLLLQHYYCTSKCIINFWNWSYCLTCGCDSLIDFVPFSRSHGQMHTSSLLDVLSFSVFTFLCFAQDRSRSAFSPSLSLPNGSDSILIVCCDLIVHCLCSVSWTRFYCSSFRSIIYSRIKQRATHISAESLIYFAAARMKSCQLTFWCGRLNCLVSCKVERSTNVSDTHHGVWYLMWNKRLRLLLLMPSSLSFFFIVSANTWCPRWRWIRLGIAQYNKRILCDWWKYLQL